MKHTELKKDDLILTRSIYGSVSVVTVHKVTSKTVQTKYLASSNIISKHGQHFGDALWVADSNKYELIKNIDKAIGKLKNEKRNILMSLERIEIGE